MLIDIDGILDMYTLPLKRGTGVKVISWEHFNYLQNPGVPYRKLTRPWAARKADAIVTLTTADKNLYEQHLNPQMSGHRHSEPNDRTEFRHRYMLLRLRRF